MMQGVKYDGQKPRLSLLPFEVTREVVKALEHGATKYAPDNWKHVPGARTRYYDALWRHTDAWWGGEAYDNGPGGSSCHHLACAICCLTFLLWFELTGTPYPPEKTEDE